MWDRELVGPVVHSLCEIVIFKIIFLFLYYSYTGGCYNE